MKNILAILFLVCLSIHSNSQTWSQLQAPNTRNLYGCWFDPVYPDTGIAVGWYLQSFDRIPFAFYTNDGGTNISAASLFQVYFYAASDVAFTNSYNGVVVGNGIIQTTNGGSTWNLVVDAAMTQAGILEDVMFANSTDGYAVGQRYDFSYTWMEGMIYRTTNAGGSWIDHTISQEVNNENTLMHAVYCTGNGTVYAGAENNLGGSTLFKSMDDGVTWSPLPFSQSIWSLYFISADTGFAATADGLYKTSDAGISWINILPTASALRSVQIKSGFGFTAGDNGIIYMTSDNGNTWMSITSPVSTTISDLSVISPNLAYAVGESGTFLKFTNTVGINREMQMTELFCWIDVDHNLNVQLTTEFKQARIELIGLDGNVVRKIADGEFRSGLKNFKTDVTSLSNGVYLVRVIHGNNSIVKKIVLLYR